MCRAPIYDVNGAFDHLIIAFSLNNVFSAFFFLLDGWVDGCKKSLCAARGVVFNFCLLCYMYKELFDDEK